MVHIERVHVFFLEVDADAETFELSDILNAVKGIAPEAGNRLCDHKVDLALLTISDHSVKAISLLRGRPCDTLVIIDLDKFPLIVTAYVFREIGTLRGEGMNLIGIIGAYPCVSR